VHILICHTRGKIGCLHTAETGGRNVKFAKRVADEMDGANPFYHNRTAAELQPSTVPLGRQVGLSISASET